MEWSIEMVSSCLSTCVGQEYILIIELRLKPAEFKLALVLLLTMPYAWPWRDLLVRRRPHIRHLPLRPLHRPSLLSWIRTVPAIPCSASVSCHLFWRTNSCQTDAAAA